MAISGISASPGPSLTFQRINKNVDEQGQQVTSELSARAGSYSRVSNFGTQSKLGSSHFQQNNQRIASLGNDNTAKLMSRAKSYSEVSNFGNETKLGSSRFQQGNEQVSNDGKRLMAQAMHQAMKNLEPDMSGAGSMMPTANAAYRTALLEKQWASEGV